MASQSFYKLEIIGVTLKCVINKGLYLIFDRNLHFGGKEFNLQTHITVKASKIISYKYTILDVMKFQHYALYFAAKHRSQANTKRLFYYIL